MIERAFKYIDWEVVEFDGITWWWTVGHNGDDKQIVICNRATASDEIYYYLVPSQLMFVIDRRCVTAANIARHKADIEWGAHIRGALA